jgi:hypothetical protein
MKNTILLIIFCLIACASSAQTKTGKKVSWDYPVKPGTEEWAALVSHAKMIEVCQIPVDVLKSLPTKELAIICLNYPLQFDFVAYDNLQTGVKKVAKTFNGLQELYLRKDNAQCLLDLLRDNNLDTANYKSLPRLRLGELIAKQSLTETLLSQELVLVNASIEQQIEIASIALKNMAIKGQAPQTYSQYSVEASAYLLCANLKRMNNGSELDTDLELFLTTGSLQSNVQIEKLKQNYQDYLNK